MIDRVHVDHAIVLRTTREKDLELIQFPHIQAVVWIPSVLPAWFAELVATLRGGPFEDHRRVLDNAGVGEIEGWLEANLPLESAAPKVLGALKQDVLDLVARHGALTGASKFMVRALTSVPSRHCGFHVDTVPPGVPPWGLLRVYNGAGTDYVDPGNVTTMRDVYRYMSRRERLVRRLAEADADGDREAGRHLLGEIVRLDELRSFLHDPSDVASAPAGSIVAFKHLDIRLHWSDHAPELAWIHCSPMKGEPRFVASVTARATLARRSTRPGPDAIAP